MYLSLIDKTDTIYIIVMPVHHGTFNIEFVIICDCQIHLCHSCKYCNQYNHTSFSCIFDCLPHRNVISCTVIDHICLIRTKCLYHSLSKIFVQRVDTYINSTFFCFFQTQITDIGNHNLCCSHPFCCLCNKISNWTCADYCDIHSFYIAHLLYSMNCNCKRLDHRPFFIRHIFRNRCYLRCIYCKIFRSRTCGLKSHYF